MCMAKAYLKHGPNKEIFLEEVASINVKGERMLGVLAAAMLTGFGAVSTGFPEDPAGIEIIDRAFYRSFTETGEAVMYFRMYNSRGRGIIEIFRYGTDEQDEGWDLVCSWKPQFEPGESVLFQPVAVITLQANENTMLVSWMNRVFLEYCEGVGAMYLEYDLDSGEVVNDFFSD